MTLRAVLYRALVKQTPKPDSLTNEISLALRHEQSAVRDEQKPIDRGITNQDVDYLSRHFAPRTERVGTESALALVKERLIASRKYRGESSIDECSKRLEKLGLNWIDEFSVDLVLRHYRSDSDLLADLLSRYVTQHRPEGNDIRKRCESLALEVFINREKSPQALDAEIYHFITSNDLILDYFIACNLAWRFSTFSSTKKAREREDKQKGLDLLYPFRVNQLLKEVIEFYKSRDTSYERKIFTSISQMIEQRGEATSVKDTYRYYVLGRLSDRKLREPIKKLLKAELTRWHNRNPDPMKCTDHDEMLLYRTLHVSLGYLGDSQSLSLYVATLLSSREQDDLNRGFHLEYFGDQPLQGEHPFTSKDYLDDFTRTRELLIKRLQNSENQLSLLEAHTLASLSQKRAEADAFSNMLERKKVIGALRKFVDSAPVVYAAENLITYLNMVTRHLEFVDFTPEGFFHSLNQTRQVKRSGWVARNASEQESVAAHTSIAVNLAMDFLPLQHEPPSGVYSKSTIIEMLLIHDRPEGILGDKQAPKKTKDDEDREREIMDLYSLMDTYMMGRDDSMMVSGLSGIGKLYREFDSGESYNAKVANDLDKIDAVYEALRLLCMPENEPFESQYYDLIHNYSSNLKTDLGKFVLQRVVRMNRKYPMILQRAHEKGKTPDAEGM